MQKRPRRQRGTGTVHQRKSGIWTAQISLGVVDGKRTRETFYGPTEDAVKDKLRRATMLLDGGQGLPSKIALGDFLTSWLEAPGHDWAIHTTRSYRTIVSNMPGWLLATTLGNLNGGHVQKWLDGMTGVSPRTIAIRRNMLRSALNDARRRDLVIRNAAALAKPPRQRPAKRTVHTPDSVTAILAALCGWRYKPAAIVAIGCGLRQGELLGLAWSDVSDRITVRASLTRVDGRYVRSPTKTEASEATVPVPAFVASALAAWEETQAEESGGRHREGLVFTTPRGRPVNGSMLTHEFQERLEAAGLPKITWHDLRHATADLLAAANTAPTVARDYMRHASYTTTATHYTGTSARLLETAAEALDRAIGST